MRKVKEWHLIVLITSIGSFITPFMSSSINIALPSIGKEFSLDSVMINWIATSYLIATAIFLLPFGKIADLHGRRKIYMIGCLLFSISSLLVIFSFTLALLITFRILQGIASSMIFSTGAAILVSAVPHEVRGKYLGINIGSVYVGLSLGPVLGGIFTGDFGWRSLFIFTSIVSFFTFILVYWKLKQEWLDNEKKKLDIIGSIMYALAIISMILGFGQFPELIGFIAIFIGVGFLLIFICFESKIEKPVLELRVFRHDKMFSFSSISSLILYSGTFAVGFLLSLYIQNVKSLTPKDAGFILISQPLIQTIFSPLAGKLSDKIEPRIVTTIGTFFILASLVQLIFIDVNSSMVWIISCLFLLGFGFALFSSPNANAMMSSVEKKDYGLASGIIATMRLLGQTFSMGIAIMVFSSIIGSIKITPASSGLFLSSLKASFTIFSIICALGSLTSFLRGNISSHMRNK
ncbi:MAG: MFS transporter [Promethearchaeota archaeon]